MRKLLLWAGVVLLCMVAGGAGALAMEYVIHRPGHELFRDVAAGSDFDDDIGFVSEYGGIGGILLGPTHDSYFLPDDPLTRAEAAHLGMETDALAFEQAVVYQKLARYAWLNAEEVRLMRWTECLLREAGRVSVADDLRRMLARYPR